MKFSHTVKTSAIPEQIWEIWVDVKNWPIWDTELESAYIEGDFTLYTKGKLKPKNAPVSVFFISEFESKKSYTFTTQLPLCKLNVKRYLTVNHSGTFFTHEISFTGLLSFLFSNLLGRKFQKVLPEVMDKLRKLAEERH
ncbi:polyketide cyclase [Nostoc sp. LEGE 06077]|uniref:SRPBCC family protein n=1 Tax=Nostoc sp. LEGE 06077 TaxID=915325 RepID=UPI001881474D|nr:SRPBCC family protein [Nostoc sp. LEGE 06077]MBE9210195.1 polyketide cyclase [Nostoc sp. LEGE 06077]